MLEITERSPIESVPDILGRVRRLRDLGFRLAVDDLGAGYAGLTSFASLEPDFVKLDRGLVAGIDHETIKQKLVGSIVRVSHEMQHRGRGRGHRDPGGARDRDGPGLRLDAGLPVPQARGAARVGELRTRHLSVSPFMSGRRPVIDYRDILENVSEGVYFVDRHRRITFWNDAASEITGYSPDALLGRECPSGPLRHVDDEGRPLCRDGCPLTSVLRDGSPRKATVFLQHRDGHRLPVRVSVRPIRDASGKITGAVETFADDSALVDSRRRASEMERLAFADMLTGLGNRRFAEQQLSRQAAAFERHGRPFGLLLIDIDHFKKVNDVWGHEVGDAVLAAVGRTLAGIIRGDDFVGRWGGEEFLALVTEADEARLVAAAERCRRMVEGCSLQHASASLSVTVSLGGALARCGEPLRLAAQARRRSALPQQGRGPEPPERRRLRMHPSLRVGTWEDLPSHVHVADDAWRSALPQPVRPLEVVRIDDAATDLLFPGACADSLSCSLSLS